MRHVLFFFLLIIGFFTNLLVLPAQAQPLSAKESMIAFLDTIKSLDFSDLENGTYKKSAARASGYLDLAAMSRAALQDHWEQASEAQLSQFLELLSALIERVAYPRSQNFLSDFEIQYSEEVPVDGGVEIESTVLRDDEALNASILYRLHLEDEHWTIYDIFLDGVSITEDLRYQWDKVIQDSSFAGLLETMQTRLDKVNAPVAAGALR